MNDVNDVLIIDNVKFNDYYNEVNYLYNVFNNMS